METLKLAFKVSTFAVKSGLMYSSRVIRIYVVVQMYESEENGEVLQEELATILEIMLGVKEVELSGVFSTLDGPETGKITYGKNRLFCH